MSPQETELVTPEEAAEAGATAPLVSAMLTLVRQFGAPSSIHASNVRAMKRAEGTTAIVCDGVVTREAVVGGTPMILIESFAPLLGFYNNGFDGDGSPLLVAAYGKPVVHKAWNVTIGPTLNPTVYSSAFHYETMVLYTVSEYTPKT